MNENPLDFLEQLKNISEDNEGNFFRGLSSQILTRICEYSDGGMTVIMYASLINLNANMDLGISESLEKEIGHLQSLNNIVETGSNDKEKLGIISASLLVLSSLSNCWEYRTNILDKVMFFIEKMSKKFSQNSISCVGDKVLACLTLVLISKFVLIFGSEKESSDKDESKRAKNGKENLGKLLNFLFMMINDADTPNSCYLFALDVVQTCFYLYKDRKKTSKTYKKNLESYTHKIFLSLLDSFSSQIEMRYFILVVNYFKFFNKKLCTEIPGEQLTKFVVLLSKTIQKQVQMIKNSTGLKDLTVLTVCLEIFSSVLSNKTIYQNLGEHLNIILENVVTSVISGNFKDEEIIEFVMEVLTVHFKQTEEFSKCHQIFLSEYWIKLSETEKSGVATEELLDLINAYCYRHAKIDK